jgi:D-beta-D-heptose 7-phosphate kinase/D-beta-D-heptose 1-phosphate adenosyltransferase
MAIVKRDKAQQYIDIIKRENKKIVFTNGCFDIIHRGHVEYLRQARNFGDFLVIGLNSDKSVNQLKGDPRPYNNEIDRAEILNNLRSVDMVTLFEEDTPLKLITELRPDILVKGGDYSIDTIVGAEEVINWGGEVKVIQFLEGYGTSQLIKKIVDSSVI